MGGFLLHQPLWILAVASFFGVGVMAQTKRIHIEDIVDYFDELEDPRCPINVKHPLVSVVVIAMMAVLAGANGPTAIARWARIKEEFLLQASWYSLQRCVSIGVVLAQARSVSTLLCRVVEIVARQRGSACCRGGADDWQADLFDRRQNVTAQP